MTEHRLLKLARRHLEAEYSGSVDATLDTLADDIVYEHPFYQHMVSGKDKMRSY
jgi:ketosteroid isomerase-like protein